MQKAPKQLQQQQQQQHPFNGLFSRISHYHPITSCFIKIQNGSAFLLPAYPGVLEKRLLNGYDDDPVYVMFHASYVIWLLMLITAHYT